MKKTTFMNRDWYEECIEPGIRPVVRLLRENGINTQCSCEHEMYVQCEIHTDGFVMVVDELLYNNGYRNYTISIIHKRVDGHLYSCMTITFK